MRLPCSRCGFLGPVGEAVDDSLGDSLAELKLLRRCEPLAARPLSRAARIQDLSVVADAAKLICEYCMQNSRPGRKLRTRIRRED